ncbi:hypothetical protein Tco_1292062, partial [Tanacetum coccineum]
LNLLLPVLVYAARHTLTAVRHKLMLPGITCYCWFWTSAKAKTVNGERQIQALEDKKKVIITETSIRSDLKLDNAKGTDCLPTATIFAELERMRCLIAKTTSRKIGSVALWHLLSYMTDLAAPTDSHSTPIHTQPSSSKPQKKKSRKKQRNDSGPTEPIPDEAINEEHVAIHSCDPPQSGVGRAGKEVAEKEVSVADPVTTAGKFKYTANVEVNTANAPKQFRVGIGGVKYEKVVRRADIIGYEASKTPFKYLGVQVGSSMFRLQYWDMVVDKIVAKLSKRKVKTLSTRRRLTLLELVLGSLPTSNFALYKVQHGLLKKLESLRSNFFRGSKMGELKLAWVRIIKAIHGTQGYYDQPPHHGKSSAWIDCVHGIHQLKQNGVDLQLNVTKCVGDGGNTMFWLDQWINDRLLKDEFLRLFAFESKKQSSVQEKMVNRLLSSLRRDPKRGEKSTQMEYLFQVLN